MIQEGFPRVQGRCPACGLAALFLGADGYVTCSSLECSDPCSASEALGVVFPYVAKASTLTDALWADVEAVGDPGGLQRLADGLRAAAEGDA